MTICPVCNKEFVNLELHIKNQHPEIFLAKEKIEEPTEKKIIKSKVSVLDKMRERFEKQNEVYMLMIEQQQLCRALSTGTVPSSEVPQSQSMKSIKEAMEMIKTIQGEAGQNQAEPVDPLLEMGGQLLMQHLANKQPVPPPPPVTPPWEENLELPEAPEPNYEEVKEVESNEDTPSCTVVNSIPSGANEPKQVKSSDTKGTKETKSD